MSPLDAVEWQVAAVAERYARQLGYAPAHFVADIDNLIRSDCGWKCSARLPGPVNPLCPEVRNA